MRQVKDFEERPQLTDAQLSALVAYKNRGDRPLADLPFHPVPALRRADPPGATARRAEPAHANRLSARPLRAPDGADAHVDAL